MEKSILLARVVTDLCSQEVEEMSRVLEALYQSGIRVKVPELQSEFKWKQNGKVPEATEQLKR